MERERRVEYSVYNPNYQSDDGELVTLKECHDQTENRDINHKTTDGVNTGKSCFQMSNRWKYIGIVLILTSIALIAVVIYFAIANTRFDDQTPEKVGNSKMLKGGNKDEIKQLNEDIRLELVQLRQELKMVLNQTDKSTDVDELMTSQNKIHDNFDKAIQNANAKINKVITDVNDLYQVYHNMYSKSQSSETDITDLKQEIWLLNSRLDSLITNSSTVTKDYMDYVTSQIDETHAKCQELALNQTIFSNEIHEQVKNLQSMLTEQNYIRQNLSTEIQVLRKDLNRTSACLTDSNEYVAMTACSKAQKPNTGDLLVFDNNVQSIGLPTHGAYNNGVFECNTKGVYAMFVSIVSHTKYGRVGLYKNNEELSVGYVTNSEDNDYHSGSGMVAAVLDSGDTLSVKALYPMTVDGLSCMTIFKVE